MSAKEGRKWTGWIALSVVSLVFGLSSSGRVNAQQLYKCQSANGKIEFTDAPCSGSRTSEKFNARDNSIDTSGSRELSLRLENEQLRQQLREQQKSNTTAPSAPQRTQADLQAERIDVLACERAKRDYEVTANSRSSGEAIIEAKRSMMYGTCGMREPDKNTTTVNTRIQVR